MDTSTLQRSIHGQVLDKSSPGFEQVLTGMLWNQLSPNRHPDLIVRAEDERDVVEAVKFAAANSLRVAARGGGHSWCGLAVRQGGMLIDLERLCRVTMDPAARRAAIEPVVSNREIIASLEPQGLAFPVGHCPEVKASGYLLSGGIGWNAGVWGHACHSVEAIDVVTARGELVRADSSANTELFWAARGGGPGFPGIAVRYHLALYPMPKAIFGSTYYYPLEHIKEVGDWVFNVAEQLPRWIEFTIFMLTAPPSLASRCGAMNGKVCMITATAFADHVAEAAAGLALLENGPLRSECLSKSVNQPTNFTELLNLSGSMWPPNLRSRVETLWSNSSTGDILLATREHFIKTPSPATVMLFALYPGWASGVPGRPETAFSMCAKVYGGPWTMWPRVEDDEVNSQWHDHNMSILRRFTVGHYLGETDIIEEPNRARDAFSPKNWERLQELRKKLDPQGLFQGFDGGL